jgi:RNA polymerase sigma-70 factor (ECF subfamily)
MAGLRDLTPHLLEAIAALPPDQQRAVELRVVEELDYAQVAERMTVTEQVARARVSRGLRAMARELAPLEATLRETA